MSEHGEARRHAAAHEGDQLRGVESQFGLHHAEFGLHHAEGVDKPGVSEVRRPPLRKAATSKCEAQLFRLIVQQYDFSTSGEVFFSFLLILVYYKPY